MDTQWQTVGIKVWQMNGLWYNFVAEYKMVDSMQVSAEMY